VTLAGIPLLLMDVVPRINSMRLCLMVAVDAVLQTSAAAVSIQRQTHTHTHTHTERERERERFRVKISRFKVSQIS